MNEFKTGFLIGLVIAVAVVAVYGLIVYAIA